MGVSLEYAIKLEDCVFKYTHIDRLYSLRKVGCFISNTLSSLIFNWSELPITFLISKNALSPINLIPSFLIIFETR